MGAKKRKGKGKGPQPSDFLMGESSNLMGLIKGNTTVPGLRKASMAEVFSAEENRMVMFKLAYTSLMMFTVPPLMYYVCITALPRLYPEMLFSHVQAAGGLVAVAFVTIICAMYAVSAYLED